MKALGLALAAGALVLAACGGGGGGGGDGDGGSAPAAPAQPPTAQGTSLTLDVRGTSSSSVAGKVSATDPQGLALTYTLANAPGIGTVALDGRSGHFTYTVGGHATSAQDSFTVAVSNGRAAAASAVVTVRLNGDPLLVNQWHIRNVGAPAFSSVPPVAGNDMNVAGAWAAGYSGKGIKVAVIDSGLEAAHEDLAANVDLASSFNFVTGSSDPTRDAGFVGRDHGTMVAGIIGATAFNGKGGRGVAYDARLRGYNYLQAQGATNYRAAMGGTAASADNAVFNLSIGFGGSLRAPDQAFIDIDNELGRMRGGLGAVMVMSAGNEFVDFGDGDPQRCVVANLAGVSCGHPAQDSRMSAPIPIVVGALNDEGRRASYSNTGASLWVSAPGGEFGFDETLFDVTRLADRESAVKPGIVTTARSGCANRAHAPGTANALVTGNHGLALNCQYTATMNGTSAAAANVSATVALMLEANPRLSARDVKYILAKTARRVDPGLASVTTTELVPGATVTLEHGWVRNAAGFWFSNSYGFGAVDAAAAVEVARTTTSPLPASRSSGRYSTTPRATEVPAGSTSGWSYTAQVDQPFTTVERVVLTVHLGTTAAAMCNQVEVVSPSGTRSILLHAANGYLQTSVPGTKLLSNAFYGERVNGTWRVTYFNFCEADLGRTLLSATQPQSIEFLGR